MLQYVTPETLTMYDHFFCLHFYLRLDFGKQTAGSASIRNSRNAYEKHVRVYSIAFFREKGQFSRTFLGFKIRNSSSSVAFL